ncbi:MAG TPA: hypothetical protein VGL05_34420, partial [Kribbella sp.]
PTPGSTASSAASGPQHPAEVSSAKLIGGLTMHEDGLSAAALGLSSFDQDRIGWRPADRPARLRLVADAYGLDGVGRSELFTAMNDALVRIEAAARRSIDAGGPNAVALMNRRGGIEKFDRRRRWWTAHYDQFAAALL